MQWESSASLDFQLNRISAEPGGTESRAAGARSERTPAGGSRMRPLVGLYLCLLLCLALGVACVLLVCLWSSRFRGGFRWDGSGREFNWHPVLMTSGLVVLYGFATVLYRVPLTWAGPKRRWKLLHAGLMLLALLLATLGLCAVFRFHQAQRIPDLYSLHSWVGLGAVLLFAAQWVAGFAGFLLPCSPPSCRKRLKPVHVWLGGSILSLSVAACVSGINEKLFFVLKGGNMTEPYSRLPPEARLANALGVVTVAFALVVLRVLTHRAWQRPDEPPQDEPPDAVYTPLTGEESD